MPPRRVQLDSVGMRGAELRQPLRHVVLMGDLNCTPEQLHTHDRFRASLPLHPVRPLLSYPSWQPRRALDHILLSDSLEAGEVRVLDHLFSDHLPIAVDVSLPPGCLQAITQQLKQVPL